MKLLKKYLVYTYSGYRRDIFELVPLNIDYPTFTSRTNEIKIIDIVVKHVINFKY